MNPNRIGRPDAANWHAAAVLLVGCALALGVAGAVLWAAVTVMTRIGG